MKVKRSSMMNEYSKSNLKFFDIPPTSKLIYMAALFVNYSNLGSLSK